MDALFMIYFGIEIFVCTIGGLITTLLISEENEWELEPKTILINLFRPQIEIVDCLDGIVNKYGKAVLIILSSPFILPLNLLLLVVQIIGIIIAAVCFVFVWIFREKDK